MVQVLVIGMKKREAPDGAPQQRKRRVEDWHAQRNDRNQQHCGDRAFVRARERECRD
jgi:hypothetical protein